MVIEEKDFRLTQPENHSYFWDLELLQTIKPRGKESRQEFKLVAYGISLQTALKYIASYRLNIKYSDNTLDLDTYIKEFKEQLNSLQHYEQEKEGVRTNC
jgi:hypothetical protein